MGVEKGAFRRACQRSRSIDSGTMVGIIAGRTAAAAAYVQAGPGRQHRRNGRL
jgi:hypothetical protein